MSTVTLRRKNQVTLPAELLAQQGFQVGDSLAFEKAPQGGIVVRRASDYQPGNAFDALNELASAIPGLDKIEFEIPRRQEAVRVADL